MIGSDGLEYADFAARVRGEPADNMRNSNILAFRRNPRWTEQQVRQYIGGFDEICPDGYPGPGPKFADAHYTGMERAGRMRGPRPDFSNRFIAQPTFVKASGRKENHDQRN